MTMELLKTLFFFFFFCSKILLFIIIIIIYYGSNYVVITQQQQQQQKCDMLPNAPKMYAYRVGKLALKHDRLFLFSNYFIMQSQQIMQVQLPPDVKPGQTITIQSPQGK